MSKLFGNMIGGCHGYRTVQRYQTRGIAIEQKGSQFLLRRTVVKNFTVKVIPDPSAMVIEDKVSPQKDGPY